MKQLTSAVLMILLVAGCVTSLNPPEFLMTSGRIHGLFAKAKERAVRANLPIIFMPHGREPHSAGGVTVDIDFQNISNKTMRRVAFTITPYDEKGIQIAGENNKNSETELTAEGYFRSEGGYYSRNWENVWYSSTIKYLQVNAVTITYLDDSTLTISNPDDLYKMAIHADTKSYLYWWSGYPIGSKETQDLKPASPAPLRSEPIQ
jgi:hypothetical protein